MLTRAYPTYGPKLCEACEVHEQADADWKKRVTAVVAELRIPTCHHANPYGCGWDEGRYAAADLVAEKLGVTGPPKPPESA